MGQHRESKIAAVGRTNPSFDPGNNQRQRQLYKRGHRLEQSKMERAVFDDFRPGDKPERRRSDRGLKGMDRGRTIEDRVRLRQKSEMGKSIERRAERRGPIQKKSDPAFQKVRGDAPRRGPTAVNPGKEAVKIPKSITGSGLNNISAGLATLGPAALAVFKNKFDKNLTSNDKEIAEQRRGIKQNKARGKMNTAVQRISDVQTKQRKEGQKRFKKHINS